MDELKIRIMLTKETLKKTLLNAAEMLDKNGSDYTEKEMKEILTAINKVINTENKLSKYQAAKYLNVSVSTFDNYVRDGKIPEGLKEEGFKEKFWTLKSLKQIKHKLDDETDN